MIFCSSCARVCSVSRSSKMRMTRSVDSKRNCTPHHVYLKFPVCVSVSFVSATAAMSVSISVSDSVSMFVAVSLCLCLQVRREPPLYRVSAHNEVKILRELDGRFGTLKVPILSVMHPFVSDRMSTTCRRHVRAVWVMYCRGCLAKYRGQNLTRT